MVFVKGACLFWNIQSNIAPIAMSVIYASRQVEWVVAARGTACLVKLVPAIR